MGTVFRGGFLLLFFFYLIRMFSDFSVKFSTSGSFDTTNLNLLLFYLVLLGFFFCFSLTYDDIIYADLLYSDR